MAKTPQSPLTADDLKRINKLLKACAETGAYLTQCHNCGLDVGPEARKNQEQLELCKRIKATFFPGEP